MIRRCAFMVTIVLVAFSCQGQVESAGDGLLAIVDDDGSIVLAGRVGGEDHVGWVARLDAVPGHWGWRKPVAIGHNHGP